MKNKKKKISAIKSFAASKLGTIFSGHPYEHFIKIQVWILLYQKAEEK